MANDFKRLWKNGKNLTGDVQFVTADGKGNQPFRAHSTVLLARFPTYRMIHPRPSTKALVVNDVDGPVFHNLLHYVYTGELPEVCLFPPHRRQT